MRKIQYEFTPGVCTVKLEEYFCSLCRHHTSSHKYRDGDGPVHRGACEAEHCKCRGASSVFMPTASGHSLSDAIGNLVLGFPSQLELEIR